LVRVRDVQESFLNIRTLRVNTPGNFPEVMLAASGPGGGGPIDERLRYALVLRPLPGINGVLALRALLALRTFGLRCASLSCQPPMLEQSSQSRVANIVAHSDQ
jgi:hypothetical protein